MRLAIPMGAAGSAGRTESVYVYVWERSLLARAPRGVDQQSKRAEINPRLHHQSAPSRCPLPKHAAAHRSGSQNPHSRWRANSRPFDHILHHCLGKFQKLGNITRTGKHQIQRGKKKKTTKPQKMLKNLMLKGCGWKDRMSSASKESCRHLLVGCGAV